PIREFERAFQALMNGGNAYSTQVIPFKIFSVSWDGYFSTFSPELLTGSHPKYGNFYFGKIGVDSPREVVNRPHFSRVYTEILQGVTNCSKSCEFFNYCGGGAPANKIFEAGSFAATTTQFCRNSIQVPFEVVLEEFELITQGRQSGTV